MTSFLGKDCRSERAGNCTDQKRKKETVSLLNEERPFPLDRLFRVEERADHLTVASESLFLLWRERNVSFLRVESDVAKTFNDRVRRISKGRLDDLRVLRNLEEF